MEVAKLIGLTNEIIDNSKIHFAIGATDKFIPLHFFCRDEFKKWQEDQNGNNFNKDYIFSLIYYGKDEWLFAGIYKKNECIESVSKENGKKKCSYNTELKDIATDLIGRLVIKFNKGFRNSYPYLKNYINDFELLEILKDKYTIEPFPGFEKVKIEFDLLKSIMAQEEESWKGALSNVKGVYLISDKNNGKLYVGSAYGENAFWGRWKEYSFNGHGNNVDLKSNIEIHGLDYANNFQFSILEIRSMSVEDSEIINRESYWKDILLTRDFGYNKN